MSEMRPLALKDLERYSLIKKIRVLQDNGYFESVSEIIKEGLCAAYFFNTTLSIEGQSEQVRQTIRIQTPHKELENYIVKRFVYNDDNISDYYLVVKDGEFEIVTFNNDYIEVKPWRKK